MPSKVWCGRAPYLVAHDRSEIQELMVEHDLIFLDLLDHAPISTSNQQVMLASAHISAVEYAPPIQFQPKVDIAQPQPSRCTCGPDEACSDCPRTQGAGSNVRFRWRK